MISSGPQAVIPVNGSSGQETRTQEEPRRFKPPQKDGSLDKIFSTTIITPLHEGSKAKANGTAATNPDPAPHAKQPTCQQANTRPNHFLPLPT